MKNLSLGMKISFGFLILLIIASAIGGAGVLSMKSVETEARLLAKEYIPEVDIAIELRGAANRLMFELRGYGFTEEARFFENAQKEFKAVDVAIDKGRGLEKRAIHLKKLKEQLDVAGKALAEYKLLAEETRETSSKMQENRNTLEASAAKYMANCKSFLDGQNEKLQGELVEGQTRIMTVTTLSGLGASARVGNFKSMLTGDKTRMTEVIKGLDMVGILIKDLDDDGFSYEDITFLGDIEDSAKEYQDALKGFLAASEGNELSKDGITENYLKKLGNISKAYEAASEEYMEILHDKLTNDMFERTTKINMINEIIDTGNTIRIASFKAQAMRNPAVMIEARKLFDDIDMGFEELLEITHSDEDIKRINEVKSAGAVYNSGMKDFLDNWILLQDIGVKRDEVGKKVVNACESLSDAGMVATVKISNDAALSLSKASISMIIGVCAALLIGIFAAFMITKSITGPVRRTIANLTEISEQVASASEQVAGASQSLAEGASDQAASIEETSASLEEMSSTTKQNAENATQADTLMNEANDVVGSANRSMGELTTSMTEIAQASEETSKIIKTIDEIAFQTNLLALNAAVEAARAGEAGAGFAVVANEVRNLAMRAADAAKNTAGLIESTVKKVSEGSKLVLKTSSAFSEVAESSTKVGSLVGEISEASREQADGIEEINKSILQMDRVTQQSAASAEESASASEEMTGQTRLMEIAVEELGRIIGGVQKRHVSDSRYENDQKNDQKNDQENVKIAEALSLPVAMPDEIRTKDFLLEEEGRGEPF